MSDSVNNYLNANRDDIVLCSIMIKEEAHIF